MTTLTRLEKVEQYGRGFEQLLTALYQVPPEAMKFKPSPSDWSIHEIIIHLADSETNSALRARKLIVEPGGMLMAYDQDKWAITLNYQEQSLEDALATTRIARKSTYELLKRQPEEIFSHWLHHSEMDEPYTFDLWLDIYSRHIPVHIEQIRNNVKFWEGKTTL